MKRVRRRPAKLGGRTSGLGRSLSADSISSGVARTWPKTRDRGMTKARAPANARTAVIRCCLVTGLQRFDYRRDLNPLVVAVSEGDGRKW